VLDRKGPHRIEWFGFFFMPIKMVNWKTRSLAWKTEKQARENSDMAFCGYRPLFRDPFPFLFFSISRK